MIASFEDQSINELPVKNIEAILPNDELFIIKMHGPPYVVLQENINESMDIDISKNHKPNISNRIFRLLTEFKNCVIGSSRNIGTSAVKYLRKPSIWSRPVNADARTDKNISKRNTIIVDNK